MRKKTSRSGALGFTLMELMIIVVVIGILTSIVISNFGDSVRRTNEKSTQANLGVIRGAVNLYMSDHNGSLSALTGLSDLTTGNPVYLRKIPAANPSPHHPSSVAVLTAAGADDAGGWVYTGDSSNAVFVNCTHTDTKGSVWTSY